jgi:xylulokinase
MWVKALDILLDRLKIVGVDFSKVASLSGTAQVSHLPIMM